MSPAVSSALVTCMSWLRSMTVVRASLRCSDTCKQHPAGSVSDRWHAYMFGCWKKQPSHLCLTHASKRARRLTAKRFSSNVLYLWTTCSTGVVSAASALASSTASTSCTMGCSFMQTGCTRLGCRACSKLLPCVPPVAACRQWQADAAHNVQAAQRQASRQASLLC